MINAKGAFKEIMLVELHDLIEDIRQLILVCAERRRREEITNYVHMENTALFNNHLLGVKGFYGDVKDYDIDKPQTTVEMASDLKSLLEDRVKRHDLAPALIPLVVRKIDKVFSYVRMGENAVAQKIEELT